MIFVLHIIVLCPFTLRTYTANVLPVSYAWSTYTGPVSGEVHEVKNDQSDPSYGRDYVAKPDYSFSYGVENPNTGDSHGHSETRDGSTVTGEYSVMEPDGILRRVLYTADPKNGFRASIRFIRPDGETISRDHGYHNNDRPPASHSTPSPEYESNDDDEQYVAPSPPLSSLNYGYDDRYNNDEINDKDNSDYEDDTDLSLFKFPLSSPSPFIKTTDPDSDDYGGSEKYYHFDTAFDGPPSSPSPFGLPSSPSPFRISSSPFSLRPSLSPYDPPSSQDDPPSSQDDPPSSPYDPPSSPHDPPSSPYDPPSSPHDPPSSPHDPSSSPLLFGLPSSPSPSFDGSTSPPSFNSDFSKRPTVKPCAPPPPSSLSPNKAIHHKTSGHSNGLGFPSEEDDDIVQSPFRSSLADFNDHGYDVRENYESDDDNDADPADAADVNLFSSIVQPSRPPSSTSKPWTPSVMTVAATPSPPLRRSTSWKRLSSLQLRPIIVTELLQLSPSSPSVMTPIEPTIIDIDA